MTARVLLNERKAASVSRKQRKKIRRDEARAQRKVEMKESTHAAAAAAAMGKLGFCGG
jgi:hypothetical protein